MVLIGIEGPGYRTGPVGPSWGFCESYRGISQATAPISHGSESVASLDPTWTGFSALSEEQSRWCIARGAAPPPHPL